MGTLIFGKNKKLKNTVFYLSTCNTCKRIFKTLDFLQDFEKQEIKKNPLTQQQLEELVALTGSYEALFSRRAQLYRKRGLKDRALTEEDFRDLILEHYTFLKRPTVVINDKVFTGGSKKVLAALQEAFDAS